MSFNFRPPGGSSGASKNSPSTPARKGKSSLFSHAPSTTPAGPPPSYLTNKSTTPAGNPPRSSKVFGSSFNAAANTFGHRNTPGRRGRGFAVPESSPPGYLDDEEDAEGEEDDEVGGEVVDEGYGTQTGRMGQHGKVLSSIEDLESPRGLKRSRNGEAREGSGMVEIARSMARDMGPAQVLEPDDVVLHTEEILGSLDETMQSLHSGVGNEQAITSATSQLTHLWTTHADTKTKPGGIGPESADPFVRATYIASLLLQLHTPNIPQSRTPTPLPAALLTWLTQNHRPFPDDFPTIHRYSPSPSAHESFWDIVGAELLRGHFPRVTRLLSDAGFDHAITALDDGASRPGYKGKQLENVEEVVARFVRVLESAPRDLDVRGAEWANFRLRVRGAMRDLETFAKGPGGGGQDDGLTDQSLDDDTETNIFARAARMSSGFDSMAAASARAGSRVPWTIYENLKTMYGVLLGGDEIMDFAQDWVEASLFFTIWWDGEESGAGLTSSLRRSRGPGAGGATREVDVAPLTAYRRRLAQMVERVTTEIDEPSFQPDSLDPVQVALVCVMEDSVEAVIELLRTWNESVAVAVVELAALGGWLPLARPSSRRGLLMQGLSSEDLMVLSQGPDPQAQSDGAIDRDQILSEYAELLAERDVFRSADGRVEKEGWELAVGVLRRLEEREVARRKIEEILGEVEVGDEVRIDKVLSLCAAMGLVEQARGIAERYADTLATTSNDTHSTSHGLALIYYARAHATVKLNSTISLLITLSLLRSAAFPSQTTMDHHLGSLLSKDRSLLAQLARSDPEAAALLARQLSGYATLRRFYELRDSDGASSLIKSSAERRREAGKALLAVIESAADCIRGGLLDPDVRDIAVVPVEALMALLGEAVPLVLPPTQQHQQGRASAMDKQTIFTLMRVLEDLDTAPARVKQGAVEIVQGALNAYHVENGGHAEAMVLSGSSWDMLASQEMARSREEGGEVVRSWDWRRGLDAVVEGRVEGRDVLMLLRTALAQEVARGFGGGLGW